MYKKIIKRGKNDLTYYYTNVRKEGKVKNIFLSSNKKEAIELERKLKNNDFKKSNVSSQPEKRTYGFGGANSLFLFLGIILTAGLFFYLFNGITGFAVIDNGVIELNVDKNVSLNSIVFLTVNLNEYNKPLSDFNFEKIDNSYYVDKINVGINEFDVNLTNGTYTFFLSLVDNGNLIAIKSQEIFIEESLDDVVIQESSKEEKDELDEEIPVEESINKTEGNVTLPEEIEIIIESNVTLQKINESKNYSSFELIEFKERIVIGKPVKWIRTIKLNKTENNFTIEIPREAKKLVINKVEDGERTKINPSNIKIEEFGNIKSVDKTN